MNFYHIEPLGFPPSNTAKYSNCKPLFCICVFISPFIEVPIRGMIKKHD